jgi:uncharacterized membrane protein
MLDFIASLWPVILTTMLPIAELRGGIPLGILGLGLDPATVIVTAIIVNALIFFPIFFILKLLYDDFFARFGWARRLIERVHKKAGPFVDRFGIWGLIIFVGIPAPVTGAWTGTAIAWLLGLDWRRSFLAVTVGVVISATIVSAVVLGGMSVFGIAAAG